MSLFSALAVAIRRFRPMSIMTFAVCLAGVPQATQGQIFVESHITTQTVMAPPLGTLVPGTIQVPLFDTLGGTRELLQMRFVQNLREQYSITWADNPHLVHVGVQVRFEVTQDIPVFYDELGVPPGQWIHSFARGRHRDPLEPGIVDVGFPALFSPGEIPVAFGNARLVENEDYLPLFIGTGSVPWQSDFLITVQVLPYGQFFDPTIITDTHIPRVDLGLQIFYAYRMVPEPAMVPAIGFASVLLGARRHRRNVNCIKT